MTQVPRAWSIFRDLPEDLYSTVRAEAGWGEFEPKQAVFLRDHPAEELHLIMTGHFAVEFTGTEGKSVVLAILGPGETFGEVALLEAGARRSASVISLDGGKTRVISRDWLTRLRERHPSVDTLLIAVLTAQVRRLSEMAFEVRVAPRQRVRRRICALARSYEGKPIPITTDVLADLAGTSRARVSEVLGEENEAGTIASRRGQIAVLDLRALEARAAAET
jgi:CRP/FNR family transcriptional regulator, cyclic AMP receptor protein